MYEFELDNTVSQVSMSVFSFWGGGGGSVGIVTPPDHGLSSTFIYFSNFIDFQTTLPRKISYFLNMKRIVGQKTEGRADVRRDSCPIVQNGRGGVREGRCPGGQASGIYERLLCFTQSR